MNRDRQCSFCGKEIAAPIIIIRGPGIQKHCARICEGCVAICARGITDKRKELREDK